MEATIPDPSSGTVFDPMYHYHDDGELLDASRCVERLHTHEPPFTRLSDEQDTSSKYLLGSLLEWPR